MIAQYRLQVKPENREKIPLFWAYRLYAWLLEQLPEEKADYFHQQERHLITQYLDHGTWVVNLLGHEAVETVGPVLENAEMIQLNEDRLTVSDYTCHRESGAAAFLHWGSQRSDKRAELRFVSPTAFKQSGRYTIFPQERLLVQSLVMRWNEVYPEYLLEDVDLLESLFNGIRIVDYSLHSSRYRLKNVLIPSFYGSIRVEAKLPVVLQEIWNALLLFSQYSGLGIKTTLGMGGIELQERADYHKSMKTSLDRAKGCSQKDSCHKTKLESAALPQ